MNWVRSAKFTTSEGIALASYLLAGFTMYRLNLSNTLDVIFSYTGLEAQQFFSQLTPDKHQRYLLKETWDLLYLASYSALLFFIARRIFPTACKGLMFFLLPGLFDLIETLTIIYLLVNSNWMEFNLDWLGLISSAKWSLAFLAIFLLFVGFARKIFRLKTT